MASVTARSCCMYRPFFAASAGWRAPYKERPWVEGAAIWYSYSSFALRWDTNPTFHAWWLVMHVLEHYYRSCYLQCNFHWFPVWPSLQCFSNTQKDSLNIPYEEQATPDLVSHCNQAPQRQHLWIHRQMVTATTAFIFIFIGLVLLYCVFFFWSSTTALRLSTGSNSSPSWPMGRACSNEVWGHSLSFKPHSQSLPTPGTNSQWELYQELIKQLLIRWLQMEGVWSKRIKWKCLMLFATESLFMPSTQKKECVIYCPIRFQLNEKQWSYQGSQKLVAVRASWGKVMIPATVTSTRINKGLLYVF